MTPNRFSAIAEDDDDFKITPREKFLKKATKKLNEIERLKEKGKYHSLTAEECLKLLKEDFWQACLYEEPLKPNIKEEKKRKKEEEKKKKEEEEKKRQEELMRQYEEKKKKEQEEKKQREETEKKKREEEIKKKKEEYEKNQTKNKKIKKDLKKLESEYKNVLLLHNGNNDKTYRLLSRKYHPDKNHNQIEWANQMQRELGVCKEKYQNYFQ